MIARKYLTVRETADRLGVHDRTVRRWQREGRLKKYTTHTGRVRCDEAEVQQLLDLREVVPT